MTREKNDSDKFRFVGMIRCYVCTFFPYFWYVCTLFYTDRRKKTPYRQRSDCPNGRFSYDTIDQYGVVSQEVAASMASNAQKLLNVDYCVSFTGNAGPTAMEGKPVGLIFIGVAIYDRVEVYRFELEGDRKTIQIEGVNNALEILGKKILENF